MVLVEKDENMPVDDAGNRADFIMDGNSRVNRMNLGGLYEQYINAASRDAGKRIRSWLGIEIGDKHAREKVAMIYQQQPELFERAWQHLVGYWKILSPKQHEWSSEMSVEEKVAELGTICEDHIYLYLPQEHAVEYHKAVAQIEQSEYRPFISPVTYVGYSGQSVRTVNNIRIGSVYLMMLEKTGDDSSTVSSAKLQHHGLPAKLTNEDKTLEPYRAQPVRAIGETEARIYASYAGAVTIAEYLDRNNNPQTHMSVVEAILSADKPTKIERIVDRNVIPYGNTKPLQIVRSIATCGGWEFCYVPDKGAVAQMKKG